jgi:hypothetical protein
MNVTDDPTVFAPPPAQYTNVNGPPLEIPGETLQALQLLAEARSGPGAAVTPSDLVNEALGAYLGGKEQSKQLEAVAKQAEADELDRVAAVHGGDAA